MNPLSKTSPLKEKQLKQQKQKTTLPKTHLQNYKKAPPNIQKFTAASHGAYRTSVTSLELKHNKLTGNDKPYLCQADLFAKGHK